ncbi:MAG: hypothetical protein ABIG64_10250 [Candidatus Omnitrophota bacterium]
MQLFRVNIHNLIVLILIQAFFWGENVYALNNFDKQIRSGSNTDTLSPAIFLRDISPGFNIIAKAVKSGLTEVEVSERWISLKQKKNTPGVLKEEEIQAIFKNKKNVIYRLARMIKQGENSYEDIELLLYVIEDNLKSEKNLNYFIEDETRRTSPIKPRKKENKTSGPDFESLRVLYDFLGFCVGFEDFDELFAIRPFIIEQINANVNYNFTRVRLKTLDDLLKKFDEFYFVWRDQNQAIELFNNKLLGMLNYWRNFVGKEEQVFYSEESRYHLGRARRNHTQMKAHDESLRKTLKDIYCTFPSKSLLKIYLERIHEQKNPVKDITQWLNGLQWMMLETMIDIFYRRELANDQRWIKWSENFKEELFLAMEEDKVRAGIVLLKIATTRNDPGLEDKILEKWQDYDDILNILLVLMERAKNEIRGQYFSLTYERIIEKINLRIQQRELSEHQVKFKQMEKLSAGSTVKLKIEALKNNTVDKAI